MNQPDDDLTSPDELRQQAWVWLRRFHLEEVKAWDAEAFKGWLSTSAAHKAAFQEARQHWRLLKPAAIELTRTGPHSLVPPMPVPDKPMRARRTFLAAAAGTAVAAGVAVAYPPFGLWPAPAEWGADERTATGEQRALMLDGSVKLTLNTQTGIRRRSADGNLAGIDLLTGEAAVELPPSGMPGGGFSVVALAGRSIAESGSFEVRCLNGRVWVSCIEGRLRVEHPAGTRLLQARQQTVYDGGSVSGVTGIRAEQLSAWRRGELVFVKTRLADVLDEINRYRPGQVVLVNRSVRDQPVSGSFFISSLDVALSLMQRTFGLHRRSLPGGVLLLT